MIAIVITFTGLSMLLRLCKPFRPLTAVLCAVMFVLCIVLMLVMPEFFLGKQFAMLDLTHILYVVILILLSPSLINAMFMVTEKIKFKY